MALGAIPGNLASSCRLLESCRNEKNINDELTIGPRSSEETGRLSGMAIGIAAGKFLDDMVFRSIAPLRNG